MESFRTNQPRVIVLDKFKPRDYQLPMLDAIENKGYKKVVAILPRRAGKDLAAWNLAIRQCLKKVCGVFYIFPTYSQAKKVIWDAITSDDGKRFLDYIPKEAIQSTNSQEMKIVFKNNSILRLLGSDNVDSLRGVNAYACIFSEYGMQDPRAYQVLRPILVASGGWSLFISTPFGRNHLYDMYRLAQSDPSWFAYRLTVDETKHISKEDIERERQEGLMSEALIQQEYYVSFDYGAEGALFAKQINEMRLAKRIGNFPWDPSEKVYTSWDLGVKDQMTILFFQLVGNTVRIIDCYSNIRQGLEHYVQVIQQKPYVYGDPGHLVPHDIHVQEQGTGITRYEVLMRLGITPIQTADVPLYDGIEASRRTLHQTFINEDTCKDFIKSLENYQQKQHPITREYTREILRNFATHYADAFRYLAVGKHKLGNEMKPEDVTNLRLKAQYGNQSPWSAPYTKSYNPYAGRF